MNVLEEKSLLTGMKCGSNYAYLLSEDSTFLSTEYKVLQSQTDSCFVKCMKMLYNGQLQLFYLTELYTPLSSMVNSLTAESFITVVTNLFADIVTIKSNGFLSCRNIDISFDRIYVDAATLQVSLLYLPVGERLYEDYASFENEIRTNLVKLISALSLLSSPKTLRLSADLINGQLSLEDILSRLKGGAAVPAPQKEYISPAEQSKELRIVAMNAPVRVEIEVTKDAFVLGKSPNGADGIIDFNKMISRVHCRIDRSGSQYTVTDLHSANGTCLNRVRLQPDKPQPLNNGDILRLANSDFQVIIG